MDLSTSYLGLSLAHPLIVGASPLGDHLDTARRLEDAGAAALVMRSLFEEQLEREKAFTLANLAAHVDAFSEARSFLPQPAEFRLGPESYLEHLAQLKKALRIPVIASLNGTSPGAWIEYARLIEQAGADALELNVYDLGSNPAERGVQVEDRLLALVGAVKRETRRMKVAIKLSPFYSSLAHLAWQLEAAGADALVLFNRFYQPDIDPEELEVKPELHLSDSSELLLRLRWLAILSGQQTIALSASGGVHTSLDAIKALMAGATTVQTVSSLVRQGPAHMATLRQGVEDWMEAHEYRSLKQLRGSMNLARCPNPRALERANYMRILQSAVDDRI
jgi:dihydroorotate dehydrogenase (fumarate)